MHSSQFCLSASLSFPLSFRALHLSLSLSLCVGSCFSISSLRFKVNGFSRKKIHTHRHTHQSEIFPMKKNRGQRPHTPEGTRCEKNGRECVPKTHTHTHTETKTINEKKTMMTDLVFVFQSFCFNSLSLLTPPSLSTQTHTQSKKPSVLHKWAKVLLNGHAAQGQRTFQISQNRCRRVQGNWRATHGSWAHQFVQICHLFPWSLNISSTRSTATDFFSAQRNPPGSQTLEQDYCKKS